MKRIVLITGATSGIGKACAQAFAANGDQIIITGRRKDRLDELKSDLENEYSAKVLCLDFDVQIKKEVDDSINSLPAEWKNIDILINNAGLALGRDLFDEADMQDWETMIDTNFKGILYVSKAILPSMIKRNQGHIINIGSIAGDDMYERGNVYCASKAAVEAISKTMRIDLLKHSIKVTNIKPGAADTEFGIVRFKGDAEKAAATYVGYQPLVAADIAQSIFYCALLPAHVCINELTITCTAQANGIYSYKK
ncbi:MAG: SDR family NAD(P)-dependent oxidoreductase [Ginsengibacter sp.]